jgi:hypothetical protein
MKAQVASSTRRMSTQASGQGYQALNSSQTGLLLKNLADLCSGEWLRSRDKGA